MRDWLWCDLQLFAADDGGAGSSDAGSDDNGGTTGNGGHQNAGEPPTDGGKTFTQDELDAIIAKRLARERKAWEQQLEEERKKAAMTEGERLRAEKEEAERRAQEAQASANQRLINAEARVQAVTLGIRPERVAYALKLADLSAVDVDDSGNPDEAAIKAALEAVLKDLPELKGAPAPQGPSGADFNGGGSAADKNPWSKEHFNLTEQGRILREDPERAKQLMAAARK